MALLNWSKEYSVDVQSIDLQHQKLFEMLNELHDAMKEGKGGQIAPAILTRLVTYTREHFAAEEGMMKRTGYPDFVRHKAEHDKLTGEVVSLVQDFAQGKVALSMKLTNFLRDWLQSHILACDKKYSAHMYAAGVR